MLDNRQNGRIEFTTATAVALWEYELKGQFSDGMWENSRPYEHWKFWCALDAVVGPVDKVTKYPYPWYCRKYSYGLNSLLPIIGDRMLKIGQLASVGGEGYHVFAAAEYMPATLAEFANCKESGKWAYNFVAEHMKHISVDLAVKFYASTYTVKDLKADLKRIKAAIKTVQR